MAQNFEMTLRRPYFDGVAEGLKTVEIRLFDEKRRLLCVGDTVVFRCAEEPHRTVRTRIVSLTTYADFAALARDNDPAALGFRGEPPEGIARVMASFYPAEEIRTYGVLAIALERIAGEGTESIF